MLAEPGMLVGATLKGFPGIDRMRGQDPHLPWESKGGRIDGFLKSGFKAPGAPLWIKLTRVSYKLW
jgi:hypothetical protein